MAEKGDAGVDEEVCIVMRGNMMCEWDLVERVKLRLYSLLSTLAFCSAYSPHYHSISMMNICQK